MQSAYDDAGTFLSFLSFTDFYPALSSAEVPLEETLRTLAYVAFFTQVHATWYPIVITGRLYELPVVA